MGAKMNFLSKLYNSKNCYADSFKHEEMGYLHVKSSLEELIEKYISEGKMVLLTGNPGDGKTFLIQSLSKAIEKYDVYVEADANCIIDQEAFVNHVLYLHRSKKPCIIAINEFPLVEFLTSLKLQAPDLCAEIIRQRERNIVYDNQPFIPLENVIVVDLNNRNLLDSDSGLPQQVLSMIIDFANKAIIEEEIINEAIKYNILVVSQKLVQERLLRILNMISRSGIHFVIRDVLGMLSYILTSGDINNDAGVETHYYNLLFSGSSKIFDALRVFDPVHFTHPQIDEELWNGNMTEGWISKEPILIPCLIEDENDAIDAYKSMKRRFFFENIDGCKLYDLMPKEYESYYNVLINCSSSNDRIKREMILGINKFFNSNDNDANALKIWTIHRYDQSKTSKAAISSQYIDINELEILTPKLPDWVKGMEYTPDHFIIRTKAKEGQPVQLKINLDFLRALIAIKNGYPSQLIPREYEYRLIKFMNALKRASSNKVLSNNYTLLDKRSNEHYDIDVIEEKFEFSRR